jgi:hypothetical protein
MKYLLRFLSTKGSCQILEKKGKTQSFKMFSDTNKLINCKITARNGVLCFRGKSEHSQNDSRNWEEK